MNWNEYRPYDDALVQEWSELPRTEAQAEFERLMAVKNERIGLLRTLLAANGIQLDSSDEAIQRLNDWLADSVEPDPEDPGHPAREWLSVGQDVALFLGDVLIERIPGLEWRLFDRGGKRHLSYQHPVIMGFDVQNRNYSVDPAWIVGGFIRDAAVGQADDERGVFLRVLRYHQSLPARSLT